MRLGYKQRARAPTHAQLWVIFTKKGAKKFSNCHEIVIFV